MTSLQRRFYMLFFIGLFLITAPVLVLFAQGYRFDRTGRIFVYSGSITIKSWPRDLDIFINGEKREKKNLNVINNSYTINGIRPGLHTIQCKKDGYTSWTKNVEVHSGISTEFWNILLFPIANREISQYSTKQIDQYFISPRVENEIVFFTSQDNQQAVSLLNIDSNEIDEIFSTEELSFLSPELRENIEWSSDNKRILIPFADGSQKVFIIARIKKENLQDIINLNELFNKKVAEEESSLLKTEKTIEQDVEFETVRWMFDKNDELVVLTTNHELYYIDINKPEEKILIETQVSGFDFAGNRIYYTQLPNNIVWEIKDNKVDTKRQITNLPIMTEDDSFITLTVYDQYRLAIETSKDELFVFNEEKEKGETTMDKLGSGIKGVQFSNDGKKLLYWTVNEIWSLMLREWKVQPIRQKGDKIFITRFSTAVQNVQWMDDYENILFSVGASIKSANIDTRWGTHIVDVHKTASDLSDRDMVYDKQNQLLFTRVDRGDGQRLETMLLIDKGFFGR